VRVRGAVRRDRGCIEMASCRARVRVRVNKKVRVRRRARVRRDGVGMASGWRRGGVLSVAARVQVQGALDGNGDG